MKGIVLAGGGGTRLHPLTKVINKHCLPVYDRPMIYYPIQSLIEVGITDILLITGGNHMSQFVELLGDGKELGCNISYKCQMNTGGIAEAILLAETFVGDDDCCVILGDNIFADSLQRFINAFYVDCVELDTPRCNIVCRPVAEPQHYGVLFDYGTSIEIIEKPQYPESDLCVTGVYFYTSDVFDKIRTLTYSGRGELEVTDLNNLYARDNKLAYSITKGDWWDVGVSIDHMLEVSNEIKNTKYGLHKRMEMYNDV